MLKSVRNFLIIYNHDHDLLVLSVNIMFVDILIGLPRFNQTINLINNL